MSLQTPIIIRDHQRKLCREALAAHCSKTPWQCGSAANSHCRHIASFQSSKVGGSKRSWGRALGSSGDAYLHYCSRHFQWPDPSLQAGIALHARTGPEMARTPWDLFCPVRLRAVAAAWQPHSARSLLLVRLARAPDGAPGGSAILVATNFMVGRCTTSASR